MRAPFVHRLQVRYGECDPQGIVFNAHYVAYFDVALTELWREALGGWNAMVATGVEAGVAERTSVDLRTDVVREGIVLVEGRLRHVFVDTATWRPVPVPERIRAGLAPYAGMGSSASAP